MAIPLRDGQPSRRFPWVTVTLMVLNVVTFLFLQPASYQYLDQENTTRREILAAQDEAGEFALRWGLVPCEIATGRPLAERPAGCDRPQIWSLPDDKPVHLPLLTSMFLHGSIDHLVGNMLFLWVFGRNVEDRLRRPWFTTVYLVGGLAAGLGFTATALRSAQPLIGASGAVAAVMGAYLVLNPRGRILTAVATAAFQLVYIPAVVVLALFFVTQFFTAEGNVAWEAHVAGMLVGAAMALPLSRLPRVMARAREDRAEAAVRHGRAF